MNTSLRYQLLKWQAMALLFFNRRDAALSCFAVMVALRPGDRYALASQAHVLAMQDRCAEALHAQERLMEANQGLLAADWFNFGYLLEASGLPERAEQAWHRALELDSRMDRAWYGLALVLIQGRRYDEAVAALRKNTELQPLSPFGWYQLARVHVDQHEPEEAVKIIRHLRRFEPKVAAQLERETGLRASPSL